MLIRNIQKKKKKTNVTDVYSHVAKCSTVINRFIS